MEKPVHFHVDTLESTNLSLWQLSEDKILGNFYTVSAGFQHRGRGQDENYWESTKDQNILMTTMVYPHFLLAENVFQISRWVSLSVVDYLKQKGLSNLHIKWPNDIYVGPKKIAGILIQNAICGHDLDKSMIGIGLNVNQTKFYSNAPNPISLQQITDTQYVIVNEINELLVCLQREYSVLQNQPQKIISKYLDLLYQKDEWCYYQIGEERTKAKIHGVDQFGRLQLEKFNGIIDVFDIKEIRFL